MVRQEFDPTSINPDVITGLLDNILSPELNATGTQTSDPGTAADIAHYLSPDSFSAPYTSIISPSWSSYLRDEQAVADRIEADKLNWDDWQQKLNRSLGRRILAKFLGNDYGYTGFPLDRLQEPAETPRVLLPAPVVIYSRETKVNHSEIERLPKFRQSSFGYLGAVSIRQTGLEGTVVQDGEEHVFNLDSPGYGLCISTRWEYDRYIFGSTFNYFPGRNRLELEKSETTDPLIDDRLSAEENMQSILEITKTAREQN